MFDDFLHYMRVRKNDKNQRNEEKYNRPKNSNLSKPFLRLPFIEKLLIFYTFYFFMPKIAYNLPGPQKVMFSTLSGLGKEKLDEPVMAL